MRDYQDKERNRFYKKMNDEQKELFHSIQDNIFTFCEAKSGTGKTTVSVASAIDLLYQGKVSKVIYIQTCSARFLDLGFLPGTLEEKTSNLYIALYDALTELGFGEKEIEEMMNNNQLITMTDNALRGCNLEDAAIVMDECVDGEHVIKTESGLFSVRELYNMLNKNKALPKALTINEETNNIEYKDILNVVLKGNRETREIVMSNKKLRCTDNHPILTVDGWKRADKVVIGDIILADSHNSNQMPVILNDDMTQVVLGSYLGDGSFRKWGINKFTGSLVNGAKQKEYLEWKADKFGDLFGGIRHLKSGYCDNLVFNARINTFITKYDLAIVGRKNHLADINIIRDIDARGIAIWVMDDGSLAKKSNTYTIWCCAFSDESIDLLIDRLKDFDIMAIRAESKGYSYIRINTDGSYKLSKLIAPYVPECMEYKIIPEHRNIPKYEWDNKVSNLGYTVATKINNDRKKVNVYDLEVADNHNFCITGFNKNLRDGIPGIFVHNCENMGYHTLKLILTRIHDNCHVVMIGDRYQKDQKGDNTVFIGYGEYLAQRIGKKVELTKNYRGRLSKLAEDYIC